MCDENDSEELAPEESDITTSDHRKFYQDGKLVLTIAEDVDHIAALRVYMDDSKFWPNCWFISDHGNPHQIEFPNNGAQVTEFAVENMGIENPQNFAGYGVSHSEYTDSAYGIGETPAEALDDCLEQIAASGEIDVEYLARRICLAEGIQTIANYEADAQSVSDYLAEESADSEADDSEAEESAELYYHVGIKFKR